MKKQAFTLGEILISLAIIGVCATMGMTLLKNAGIDDRAIKVSADKAVTSFSTAMQGVMGQDTKSGKLNAIIDPSDVTPAGEDRSFKNECTTSKCVMEVMKKHMTITKTFTAEEMLLTSGNTAPWPAEQGPAGDAFDVRVGTYSCGALSDGTVFCVDYKQACDKSGVRIMEKTDADKRRAKNVCGVIYYDVNGSQKPNTTGRDRFSMVFGKYGVRMPAPK